MQRRRDTMWAAATSVPSVSSVPGSHAACICSKSCRSSLWICRLEQVAERQQPLVKAGRRVCLETADHGPHGFVVRDQRIDLTLAVDEGQPGGRKHVRLVDLEMRPQVTLIECQQPQHLLRQVGRPTRRAGWVRALRARESTAAPSSGRCCDLATVVRGSRATPAGTLSPASYCRWPADGRQHSTGTWARLHDRQKDFAQNLIIGDVRRPT